MAIAALYEYILNQAYCNSHARVGDLIQMDLRYQTIYTYFRPDLTLPFDHTDIELEPTTLREGVFSYQFTKEGCLDISGRLCR
jgi:hypothetical protein